MAQFHTLTIKEIHRETENSVTISFSVPEDLKPNFAFKSGQYITLKTAINGNEIRRDYSLCSSPKSGEIKVAVKAITDGTFSMYANNQLKAGDTLEVAAPKGKFVFEANDKKTKNVALFAAGSGITPVLSIVKCALEEEVNSQIILVYGNKTPKDTMFFDELLTLQHTYKDRFVIQFVFSQTDEDDAIFGRIEKSTVNYVVKNKYKHIECDAFYRIHFELFKASKPAEIEPTTVSNGQTEITVVVDDEETTFEMAQKDTILEAALDKDLDAPYSCQGGICSSCLARVTEGEATMRQNNILTDNEVAEGLILTCQAHPTTAKITVDFDDI